MGCDGAPQGGPRDTPHPDHRAQRARDAEPSASGAGGRRRRLRHQAGPVRPADGEDRSAADDKTRRLSVGAGLAYFLAPAFFRFAGVFFALFAFFFTAFAFFAEAFFVAFFDALLRGAKPPPGSFSTSGSTLNTCGG